MSKETVKDEPTCIESYGDTCTGPVEYRFGYGLKGSYVRCLGHWEAYMDRMEGVRRRYPDTATPPADFDPTYAGESWDED
ncbi:hypothetical protein SEA_OCTOBIEN14_131 [Gordonia phage Octobien14]|uniref:Uncharacterized protein n=1 Tax=Gordonia phage Octobien14 TaxID=2483673 RepID=A0A3G3M9W4_9CAUD|nr:hypothetical protein L3Y22_gp113 [Gordonia phage Octobien14]AYR03266.1 hypothetical protein SEA_OCTOBIEN14_131 [Gordonia phage Octobien14]